MKHEIPKINLRTSAQENCVPFCGFGTFLRRVRALFDYNGFTDYRFSETPINGAENEPAFLYLLEGYKRTYPEKHKTYLIAKLEKDDLLKISREISLWTDNVSSAKRLNEDELRKELIANGFSDEEINEIVGHH